MNPRSRRNRWLLLSALLVAMLLVAVLWYRSYSSYAILAREAYSGIGTELMAVRGNAIFYHYNNYRDTPPPQSWSFGWAPQDSRMGKRMRTEYDFSEAPARLNRLGFVGISRPEFGPGSTMILIAAPFWFVELCLGALPIGVICLRRFFQARFPATAVSDERSV